MTPAAPRLAPAAVRIGTWYTRIADTNAHNGAVESACRDVSLECRKILDSEDLPWLKGL